MIRNTGFRWKSITVFRIDPNTGNTGITDTGFNPLIPILLEIFNNRSGFFF